MSTEVKTTGRRVLTGVVVSTKMDKTVTVEVTRLVKDQRVRKYVRRRKTYKAHDEDNVCAMGETVSIRESRPLSRLKRWVVVDSAAADQ